MASKNDAHYAVLVGISHYVDSATLPQLDGPSADVDAVHHWLLREDGGNLPAPNVRIVQASTDAQSRPLEPTATAVYSALSTVNLEMKHRVELDSDPTAYERSRLYIYVAGHGMSAPGVSAALFTVEAVDGMWGTGLNLTACARWYVDHGPFVEVVLLADCCRAHYKDVAVMGVMLDPWRITRGTNDPNVLTMFATLSDAIALERPTPSDPNVTRGLFTRALLEAVDVDVDDTGYATGQSVDAGVRRRVRSWTAPPSPPPQQTSETVGKFSPVMTFGRLRPPQLAHLSIPVGSGRFGSTDRLMLFTGGKEQDPVETCFAGDVGPTWEVDVLPGLYRLCRLFPDGTYQRVDLLDTEDAIDD